MKQYLDLLQKILTEGEKKQDRTNTGTLSLFGEQMHFDLKKSFPCLTTKKIHFKSIVYELLWILKGDTNIKYLNDNGVTIWNEWADEKGELGAIYGKQWRHWKTADGEIDQISKLIENLKNDPYSRRHIVSAWNPADIENMTLPPCHTLFQFNVCNNHLSCHLYQRSADFFLGSPFNIASYSLLTIMIAQICGFKAHKFVWSGGDIHVYLNHLDAVKEQLLRDPFDLPQVQLNPNITNIFDFDFEDITLINYKSHGKIKAIAPIAV